MASFIHHARSSPFPHGLVHKLRHEGRFFLLFIHNDSGPEQEEQTHDEPSERSEWEVKDMTAYNRVQDNAARIQNLIKSEVMDEGRERTKGKEWILVSSSVLNLNPDKRTRINPL